MDFLDSLPPQPPLQQAGAHASPLLGLLKLDSADDADFDKLCVVVDFGTTNTPLKACTREFRQEAATAQHIIAAIRGLLSKGAMSALVLRGKMIVARAFPATVSRENLSAQCDTDDMLPP